MNILVAGATGMLGHRLVERLVDRGHEVRGLSRGPDGDDLVESRGGVPVRGDVLDRGSLEQAAENVDVVVHAATALPVKTKPSDEDWKRNDRVRLEGARNLVAATDNLETILFPSVVWLARQPDGSVFDEDADRHPDRATQSAAEVEDYLQETAAKHGFDATILRFGFFYAPDAEHTHQFGKQLLSGDLPVVGGGLLGRRDAELSFLHADDAALACADALEADATGLYHVVDDEPVTAAAFFTELAERLDTSDPSRVPGWLAKFFVGTVTAELLTSPMSTTSDRFQRDVDWEPRYPTYRKGLKQVVDTWKNSGMLHETPTGYEWAEG